MYIIMPVQGQVYSASGSFSVLTPRPTDDWLAALHQARSVHAMMYASVKLGDMRRPFMKGGTYIASLWRVCCNFLITFLRYAANIGMWW